MDKIYLYKTDYDKLEIEEKEKILNKIATHYGFQIKEYALFERYGVSLYTAIYDNNGREFVFIPGAKGISLGWKKTINGKNEDTFLIHYIKSAMFDYFLSLIEENDRYAKYAKYASYPSLEALKEELSEREYNALDKYLTTTTLNYIDDCTSFSKKMDISPMLVERVSESVNWEFTKNIPANIVADSPTYFKIYQDIIKSSKTYIIKESKTKNNIVKKQKFVIDNHGLKVYKYKELNNEEIMFQYMSNGYNIPNKTQWEYLASTGINKLFPEDNILYKSNPIKVCNGFGLFISNNVYEPEIVSDDKFIYKGGDSGFYNMFIAKELTNFSLSPYYSTKSSNVTYTDNSGLYARKIIEVNLNKEYKPKVSKGNINKFIEENLKKENFDTIIYAVNSINYNGVNFLNAVKVIEIYHMKGFINKSLELVEKYAEEGRYLPEFLYLSAYTYFRLQNLEKATELLNKAISIKRNMPECYQLLSYIYHKTNNQSALKQSFHNLFLLAPNIAEGMAPIVFPKGVTSQDGDYEDLWVELYATYTEEIKNIGKNGVVKDYLSETFLLQSILQLLITGGFHEYISKIAENSNGYMLKIINDIENSKYIVDDGTYLEHKDFLQAQEEFLGCKNIFYEIENINIEEIDKEYIQDLTNTFFDCYPAFVTFAYIHYSNSRIFEAKNVFDTDYHLCLSLYQRKQIPVTLIDELRVMLEEFIMDITTNIYTYGQLNIIIADILDKTNDITDKYKEKLPNLANTIENNMLNDLKYILEWFQIDIEINITT